MLTYCCLHFFELHHHPIPHCSYTSVFYLRQHLPIKNGERKKHTVGTEPKTNRTNLERGKIDTANTHIHDSSLPWLGIGSSIKYGGVKLVLLAQ